MGWEAPVNATNLNNLLKNAESDETPRCCVHGNRIQFAAEVAGLTFGKDLIVEI